MRLIESSHSTIDKLIRWNMIPTHELTVEQKRGGDLKVVVENFS
jgi:hypothetical protein